MDNKFQVPRIPVVSASSLLRNTSTTGTGTKKRSSKSSSKKVLSQSAAAAALAAKKVVSRAALVQQQQLQPLANEEKKAAKGGNGGNSSQSFLPADVLPKLCPSCSQILVQYLSPIESYIRKLISHVDQIKTVAESAQQQTTLSTFEFTTNETTAIDHQSKQQQSVSKTSKKSSSTRSSTAAAAAGGAKVPQSSKTSAAAAAVASSKATAASKANRGKAVAPNAHTAGTTVAAGGGGNSGGGEYSSQHFSNANNGGNHGGGHDSVTISAPMSGNSGDHGQANQSTANNNGNSSNHVSGDGHQQHHQQQQQVQQHQHHSQPPPFSGHPSEHHQQKTQQPQQQQQHQGSTGGESAVVSSTNQSFHHPHQPQQQQQQHHYQQHQETASGNDHYHQQTMATDDHHHDAQNFSNESHQEFTATEEGKVPSFEEQQQQHQSNWTSEVESSTCPYAYVTLAYDNLSTVNAILLANSIQLFNNQVLNVLEDSEQDNLKSSKRIVHQYHIPTVILLCDSNINRTLKQVVYQVFDKVIESKYQDAVLLNDESLGIQQYKIHLWKELAFQYEKCIFLESFTMVVGEISDLLLHAEELSASVDCFIPDHFNCSVFVFEPSMETYKNLLRLGLQLKLNEGNEDGERKDGRGFDAATDTLDEMTLLNQFFAPHWRKLSFIYNFVRNDFTYTQVPAYFKFGDNIRIVNFGSNAAAQHASMTSPSSDSSSSNFFNSPLQPWNYKFNLAKATLEEDPFESAPVDNYCKFYLRCFVRRLWPLLSQTITPYLLSHHNGITEWTVFDLVQILGRQSGEGFAQNPVTLSRKKSWAVDAHLQQQLQQQLALEHQQEQEQEKERQQQQQQQQQSASEVENDEDDDQEASTVIASADDDDDAGGAGGDESGDDHLQQQQQQQQSSEESKRQWEAGRVDWMGEHQSDRIINRLKHLIHQ